MTEDKIWKRNTCRLSIDYVSTVCQIETMIMLAESGGNQNRVELLKLNDADSCLSKICSTPLPLKASYAYSLTSIDGEEVILAGGRYSFGTDFPVLPSVYEGFLNENKDDVQWNQLQDLKRARFSHAAFYLKNKLYIVGGRITYRNWLDCCEVYDVKKKTWSDGPSLPYVMYRPTAITDRNGTFALILGRKISIYGKTLMIIFDDKNGFQEALSDNVNFDIKQVATSIE